MYLYTNVPSPLYVSTQLGELIHFPVEALLQIKQCLVIAGWEEKTSEGSKMLPPSEYIPVSVWVDKEGIQECDVLVAYFIELSTSDMYVPVVLSHHYILNHMENKFIEYVKWLGHSRFSPEDVQGDVQLVKAFFEHLRHSMDILYVMMPFISNQMGICKELLSLTNRFIFSINKVPSSTVEIFR